MPSSHSINRHLVFVDYANKLSPTLKSFMFGSARLECPDFLFEILIECRLDIGHTKMRFKLVKIRNFYYLHCIGA